MGATIGVGAILSVAHRTIGAGGGAFHGHSYEVVAWFPEGGNAVSHQQGLEATLRRIDHTTLSDDMSHAEDIGRWVAERLDGCVEVEIKRPLERIYVRVRP